MYAALIRASQTWKRVVSSEFELRRAYRARREKRIRAALRLRAAYGIAKATLAKTLAKIKPWAGP